MRQFGIKTVIYAQSVSVQSMLKQFIFNKTAQQFHITFTNKKYASIVYGTQNAFSQMQVDQLLGFKNS